MARGQSRANKHTMQHCQQGTERAVAIVPRLGSMARTRSRAHARLETACFGCSAALDLRTARAPEQPTRTLILALPALDLVWGAPEPVGQQGADQTRRSCGPYLTSNPTWRLPSSHAKPDRWAARQPSPSLKQSACPPGLSCGTCRRSSSMPAPSTTADSPCEHDWCSLSDCKQDSWTHQCQRSRVHGQTEH